MPRIWPFKFWENLSLSNQQHSCTVLQSLCSSGFFFFFDNFEFNLQYFMGYSWAYTNLILLLTVIVLNVTIPRQHGHVSRSLYQSASFAWRWVVIIHHSSNKQTMLNEANIHPTALYVEFNWRMQLFLYKPHNYTPRGGGCLCSWIMLSVHVGHSPTLSKGKCRLHLINVEWYQIHEHMLTYHTFQENQCVF